MSSTWVCVLYRLLTSTWSINWLPIRPYNEYGSTYFTFGEVLFLQDYQEVALDAGSLIVDRTDQLPWL
jgi:hypothetical protein